MELIWAVDVLDNPLDRLAMYEAAVQQVYTLCQHDGVATGVTSEIRASNALVRARIFWYAYVHEGLTTGLRGGRLLMFVIIPIPVCLNSDSFLGMMMI
jgi:hypothetical protein